MKESNTAYKVAVSTGLYAKPQGLRGKYDHVRRFWEDEVTRFFLRPYLTRLRKRRRQEGIRILDLGCGSGDGFELLTGSRDPSRPVADASNEVLPFQEVAFYKGIDLSEELLEQGRAVFQGLAQVEFGRGDFSQGLPVASGEPAYDIYFTSYGTMSHCHDWEAVRLLSEIALHAAPGSVVMADWLGAYSFEWQDLWISPLEEDYVMDYYVSYLYDNPRAAACHLPALRLRLMDQPTLLRILEKANDRAGGRLVLREIFDRSIFVGRHVETGNYNQFPQPLRTMINSLFEPGVRTDLAGLRVNYQPKAGFTQNNACLKRCADWWNELVEFTAEAVLNHMPKSRNVFMGPRGKIPAAVKPLFERMAGLFSSLSDLEVEDIRANFIEPQLAYALRNLEISLQKGTGIGHGIVAILEVM